MPWTASGGSPISTSSIASVIGRHPPPGPSLKRASVKTSSCVLPSQLAIGSVAAANSVTSCWTISSLVKAAGWAISRVVMSSPGTDILWAMRSPRARSRVALIFSVSAESVASNISTSAPATWVPMLSGQPRSLLIIEKASGTAYSDRMSAWPRWQKVLMSVVPRARTSGRTR